MACGMCINTGVRVTSYPGTGERYGKKKRGTSPFAQTCLVCRAVSGAGPAVDYAVRPAAIEPVASESDADAATVAA